MKPKQRKATTAGRRATNPAQNPELMPEETSEVPKENGSGSNKRKQTKKAHRNESITKNSTPNTPQICKKREKATPHLDDEATTARFIENDVPVVLKVSSQERAEFETDTENVAQQDMEASDEGEAIYQSEDRHDSDDRGVETSDSTPEETREPRSTKETSDQCLDERMVHKRSNAGVRKKLRKRCKKDAAIMKAFDKLKNMMESGGYMDSEEEQQDGEYRESRRCSQARSRSKGRKCSREPSRDRGKNKFLLTNRDSVTTIYRPAVKPKRGSSSSETAGINSGNDTVILDLSNSEPGMMELPECNRELKGPSDSFVHELVSDFCRCSQGRERDYDSHERDQEPRRHRDSDRQDTRGYDARQVGADRAYQAIRDAEASKARIYDATGKQHQTLVNPMSGNKSNAEQNQMANLSRDFVHSMMVDGVYMMVVSHLDETVIQKITEGKYVDFPKLLPRNQVRSENDNRMEVVNNQGQLFWQPYSERDSIQINSLAKWEQAFRIYSDVYTKANPQRASELIQYDHVINTVARNHPWENVYRYDQEFRIHMGKYPDRSWGIILQQAWTMIMCEKGGGPTSSHGGNNRNFEQHKGESVKEKKSGKPCYKYNRGKCLYGINCKFEHRCVVCNKYGHGAFNCRKLANSAGDKEVGDKQFGKKK